MWISGKRFLDPRAAAYPAGAMKEKRNVATRGLDFLEILRDEPTIGRHAGGAGGAADIRACTSPAKAGGAGRKHLEETPSLADRLRWARICCNRGFTKVAYWEIRYEQHFMSASTPDL